MIDRDDIDSDMFGDGEELGAVIDQFDPTLIPAPRVLPKWRAAQVAWSSHEPYSADVYDYYEGVAASGRFPVLLGGGDPTEDDDIATRMARVMMFEQLTFSGDLFALTHGATHYAMRRARDTVKDEAVHVDRLPVVGGKTARSGVMLFGDAIGVAPHINRQRAVNERGAHIEAVAPMILAAWATIQVEFKDTGKTALMAHMTFYSQGRDSLTARRSYPYATPPPFAYNHSVIWPMIRPDEEPPYYTETLNFYDSSQRRRARYLIAAWDAYNKSALIDATTIRPGAKGRTRAQLKKAAKGAKHTEHDPVRVLTFRPDKREYKPTGPRDAKGREYSCRWLVAPHVKHYHVKDPVTGEKRREPRDIEEYVAGPRDKPLRLRETVRLIDR